MRLRNVKGAREKIISSPYVILNPENYKGHFKELFINDNPIYLEIGMGKGRFLIESAKKNPQINFIGIEKFDSVLVKAVNTLETLKLDNIKLISMDASNIEKIFNKEISLLYLNFSDPWPKKRHEQRRLTSPIFLKKYEQIFEAKARIVMKTDNRKLFEYSLLTFSANNYIFKNISLDLHQDNTENIVTEYEEKFATKGYPIYKVEVLKNLDKDFTKKN